MIHNHISKGRFYLVFSMILLAFGVILTRLYFLHVIEADLYADTIEKTRKRSSIIEARRGNILDRNGNLIATTRSKIILGADPEVVDLEKKEELDALSKVLQRSTDSIVDTIQSAKQRDLKRPIRWVVLEEGLDESDYDKIKDIGLKGVYGNRKFERAYSGNQMASHVVGYLNKERIPCMGVEAMMNYYLEGQDGSRDTERDGKRRELPQYRNRQVDPKNGMDVQLTIDVSIQSAVEEELDRIVSDFSPNGATVIVSEPSTGYILALGNRPTFDPNEFWNYEIENQRNRAITDIYEPGSVFKVVTVCAALNEGIVSPEQIFDCDIAKARYHGRVVKLPSDHDPLGKISVRQIVAKSSNRGAAYLGMMLGENRLYDYARSFGFGHKTGFLLGGEVNGILHPVDRWDGLTITRLPMGHAISATPMQVHNMMASVANGGVLMHPQIVRRVIDEGAQVVSFEPQQQRRVVSPEAAKVMSEMLAEVVGPDGTAKQAILQGYRVAGKTGTTQKIINGKYSRNAHVASFVGYFPADNPRVVISIVVDEPNLKGVGYGGVVAAPSFKRIAKEVIRYLGIEPVEREDKGIAYIKPVNSDYYVFN